MLPVLHALYDPAVCVPGDKTGYQGHVARRLPMVYRAGGFLLHCSLGRRFTSLVDSRTIAGSVAVVAQLVEPRIVIPVVVGSSPIVHPSISFNPSLGR